MTQREEHPWINGGPAPDRLDQKQVGFLSDHDAELTSDTVRILDVRIHRLTVDELNRELGRLVDGKKHGLILNVNIHGMNLAATNPWLRQLLEHADVVVCDGSGVVLGGRLLGHTMLPRITQADWMWQMAIYAERRGYSLYFLGARPGIAGLAADHLRRQFPRLRVVGSHHGYFDHAYDSAENHAVIAGINELKPDILVLGMGMPLQERWLLENWHRVDAQVALTGGAVFDYVSGTLRRAPGWMTNNHLEWLGRLAIEPTRLWRRYLLGNPLFMTRILRQRFRGR